jgi:PAS domain S-box-containing protein
VNDDDVSEDQARGHRWLAGLFGEVDDCLYLKDRDGRYLDANSATAAVLGCSEKEIIGFTDADFFPPAMAESIKAIDRRVLEGESVRLEQELPHADGERHIFLTRKLPWTDGDGHVLGIAGIATDITDTVFTRSALSDSETRLKTLFEEAPIGKAVVALDGTWLDVNPALSRITGYSRQELLAGRAQDITHPEDLDADAPHLVDLMERRGTTYEVEKRYVRADGEAVWVHQSVSLVRNDDGTPRYFIHQVLDVTERIEARRQLEEALLTSERANEDLRRADELKDHLLTVTSHELRTPLTAVHGFAQLLATRYDALREQDRREAITAIERQTMRLGRMISDLLMLSELRAGAIRPKPTDVPLVQVVAELLRRYPDTATEAPIDLVVRADRERLTDILLRLVDNAFQHGKPPVALTATPEGAAVVLSVEDHGEGVPAEFVPQLFESFTQADSGLRRRTSGAGLGLALVAELVSAMAGDVWYETRDGGGARMKIRLPAAH